jgi:predicted transcriptional regulator
MTAYLVSGQLMGNSIMTEKIARRGVRVPSEYGADPLDRITVGDACSREVVTLPASQSLSTTREWLFSGDVDAGHQGYPIIEDDGRIVGVLTRRDLIGTVRHGEAPLRTLVTRPPAVVAEDHSLRDAADHMVDENIGRLVVVDAAEPTRMTGFITRGDLLAAHATRLREARESRRTLSLRRSRG